MSENKTYPKMLKNLTQNDLKIQFDYDAENGWLIRKLKSGKRKLVGHKPTCNGYSQIRVNGKKYYIHRLIWLWHKGQFPTKFIDHIDRNPMNNRIENLREVEQMENMHNYKAPITNTSGFPGVNWRKDRGKYEVYIKANNKKKHLGYSITLEEAKILFKKAKIEFHPSSPDAKFYAEELGISINESS